MTNPYLNLGEQTNPYLDLDKEEEEKKKKRDAFSKVPESFGGPGTKDFLQSVAAGATKATGSIVEALGHLGDKAAEMIPDWIDQGNTFGGNNPFVKGGKKLQEKGASFNENVPQSSQRTIGEFAGSLAPGLVVGAATAGMVNPLVGGLQQKLLGGVASRAASMVTSTAAKKAIEVGIVTLPQEMIGGVISETLMNPEAFENGKSVLRVLALSTLGSGINAGFAYRGAIKAAKTIPELDALSTQVKEVFKEPLRLDEYQPKGKVDLPSPQAQANPFAQTSSGVQLDPFSQRTSIPPDFLEGYRVDSPENLGKKMDAQDPNNLPDYKQAAQKRIQERLELEIEQRRMALEKGPKIVDPNPIIKTSSVLDPIELAAIKGSEDRLAQTQALHAEPLGGKGVKTDPNLLEGVTPDPRSYLTLDELKDHLQILNMRGILDMPSSGQSKLKAYQKKFQRIQMRLDNAAAENLKFLDPGEEKELVDEMLAMSKRLSRGFEVVPPNAKIQGKQTPDIPTFPKFLESIQPSSKSVESVMGSDLSTTAKLDSNIPLAHVVDDSHKRWITGSDDKPIPVAPQQVQVAQQEAKDFATLVREAKIDYTDESQGLASKAWYKIKHAKQEFYDRTWGIGQYSSEARDRLNLLSGVSAYSENFLQREVRKIVLEADGTWKGKTEVIPVRPINKLADGLDPDEITGLDALLKARVKIDNPGLEIGKDLQWAQDVQRLAGPKLNAIADEFKVSMDVLIDDAVALGHLSKAAGDRYKSTFYASMARSFNESTSSNPFRRRYGSTRDTKSPLRMAQDNVFKWQETIHKNHAYNALVDDFEKNWAKYEGVMAPAEEVSSKAWQARVEELVDDGMPSIDAEQIASMEAPPFDKSNGTLRVIRNGQIKFFKVNKDIARTIEAMNPIEFSFFRAVLGTIARPIRASVPIALDLSGIGPASDMILTTAKVPNFIPVVDNLRGAWHSAIRSPEYMERTAALGAFGGRFEPEAFIPKTGAAAKVQKVGDALMIPFKMLQALTRPLADAARMGEYLVRTQRNGESAQAAALATRRTLGDFNRHGASLRTWGLVTEFGNVGITTSGAAYQLGRDAVNGLKNGNPAPAIRAITAGVGGITIPTIMLWRAAQDDDELKAKMATDRGYRYWWFRGPSSEKHPEGEIMKMPIPGWWMGSVFGSSTMAWLDGLGKEEAKRFGDAFYSQVGFNTIPIPVQTMVGALTNTRNPLSPFEKNIPITPSSQQRLLPEAMGGPNTSPLGAFASEHGINPHRVDFLVDRVTGNLFSPTIKLLGGGKVGGMEKGDIPIYGRFFEKKGGPSEGSEAFYRDAALAAKVQASYEVFRKTGNAQAIEKLVTEHEELFARKALLESVGTKVADLRKKIQEIALDPEMSKEGKREYINAFYEAMDEVFLAYAPMKVKK